MAVAANGVAGQVSLLVQEGKKAPQDPEPGGACRGGQSVPGCAVEPGIDILGRGVRKILDDVLSLGLGEQEAERFQGSDNLFERARGILACP